MLWSVNAITTRIMDEDALPGHESRLPCLAPTKLSYSQQRAEYREPIQYHPQGLENLQE